MNWNHKWSLYHVNVNVNVMVENVIHIKSGITITVNGSAKIIIYKKDYIWNPVTCSCENGKYLASTIDGSVIMCDEIIDAETKSYAK